MRIVRTSRRVGTALIAVLLFAVVPEASAGAAAEDPLLPLLRRMDRYFQQHEIEGVTMDSRYAINPSEAIRQSVVCQVLGYSELYKQFHTRAIRREIAGHADYLIDHLEAVRSHTPFDGMLAYSLLAAQEATGEDRFLAAGTTVVNELLAIPTSECILNGGLMVAMATAEYWRLTGDGAAEQKTRDILAQLGPFQNEDGSFPHWCGGSRDVHYTGWMAEELIHLQRMTGNPVIEPSLVRMLAFMEGRIDSNGSTRYEEPCPDRPGCTLYYYSRRTGCSIDYDTRGWTVEPGYSALLFDHFRSPKYFDVMRFLVSLENQGTFPDLWGYWPPPEDPEYPWTVADTSVANMSILFWTLASLYDGRDRRSFAAHTWEPEPGVRRLPLARRAGRWPAGIEIGQRSPRREAMRLEAIAPNPARDACRVRFSMVESAAASLSVHDAAGRRVQALATGELRAGEHDVGWDLRDARGRPSPSGLYFVILRVGERVQTRQVLVLR